MRLSQVLRVVHVVLLLELCSDEVVGSKIEAKLYRDLLSNYSAWVRPVRNPKKALMVSMRVYLQQILNVDAKHQMVEVNAWLKYVWTDYRLRWRPVDYDNISTIRFLGGEEQIWQPDILLYNRYIDNEQESFDSTYKANIVVYSDGLVNWIPPGIFKLSCKMDITLFPFDEQICFMKFGSWTYHGFALDLRIDSVDNDEPSADLSTFISNGEWHLVQAPAVREEKFYKCCREPYPTVRFFLHMRRRTIFYLFNVLLPSLLVSFMSLLAFCLPATDMSEKIGLQTTILLSVCFFLTILSEMTPTTSEAVPLLGVFFSVVTFIVSISTTFTILVLNIRYRQFGNHAMAPVFRTMFLEFLPWLMMMRRPEHHFHKAGVSKIAEQDECVQCSERREFSEVRRSDGEDDAIANLCPFPTEKLSIGRKVGDGLFVHRRCNAHEKSRTEKFERGMKACERAIHEENPELAQTLLSTIKLYEVIVDQVARIRRRIAIKRERKDVEEEWKFAAMALDRFCLLLFSVLMLVCCAAVIFLPPSVKIFE
ncbi:unnamed protein product [Caenorhabditis auriculariae]|uniref:Uncharacterized protein n=1 Tax=Caenorhabditis auriculariae TaxID=2777116 RepID=A0A8S1HWP9_9PELO|nr:unnamed protein product [Caenorhabditis auriculariae]